MKTKFKSYGYFLGIALVGVVVGTFLQFAKAWSEPTVAPPGVSIGAPINISGNNQAKAGALTVGALNTPQICLGGVCQTSWPSAAGDNLGSHIATNVLNMNGNSISNARVIASDMISVAGGNIVAGPGGASLNKVTGIAFSDGTRITSANKTACQWESVGTTNTKTGGTISKICTDSDAVMRGFKIEGMGGGDHNAVFPISIYCCR